ncbi:uncharacterized protein LOC122148753 isoform X2 [Cyprinus carpio]|nr:uncharacterized protein LOC122148753 isoform X2 [Cyprinus carpio]
MRVFYSKDQKELEQQITYQLHIHDEISMKIGEELKMSVLLSNADKVETNSSGEWKEVWSRTDGVLDHHLTDTDGNLTIKGFTANDTGTYRVLDSEGEILITVTVTESRTESKGELDDDKTYDPKYMYVVAVVFGVLVTLIIFVVIKKHQHQQRNPEHDPDPGPIKSPEHLAAPLITCNLPSVPTDP